MLREDVSDFDWTESEETDRDRIGRSMCDVGDANCFISSTHYAVPNHEARFVASKDEEMGPRSVATARGFSIEPSRS
jgi:hypothetical protein